MLTPSIRPASESDLELLPALETASDTLLAGLSGIRGELLENLPAPPGTGELAAARRILVAGHPPAGFARLEQVGAFAHLEQLSVHPDAAGAGLGRALVEASLAWARGAGYPGMTLCTFARVPFNAPFYRSCGFEIVEPRGELAEVRRHEAEVGLDSIGERVAMSIRFQERS